MRRLSEVQEAVPKGLENVVRVREKTPEDSENMEVMDKRELVGGGAIFSA